ncbi:M28 family metallopeptidase, partial [Schnuerera sp.]|uniref:M28 family metallopeptidase n=1 Tax=Schnuerera sp. TaxID=2794844 RepID=UPI002B5FFD92
LEFLTSEECNGRLPGTKGNARAEEYIENFFKEIELEPYDDSYLFEYIHSGWDIIKENFNMAIEFSNGEVMNCKYGEDYIENFMTNIEFKGELVMDYENVDMKNKFVLLENRNNIGNVRDQATGVIYPVDSFRIGVPNYQENIMPIIQISSKVYDQIIEKGVSEIYIKFQIEGENEEFPQNNVVGILPGQNRDNAIVLTAHFDHVGSKGDMIWQGAIDNGTGVAALIDIAEKLKSYSEKEILEQDIVFCAFNGEESFFQGSIPFVNDISNKYENLYNINIDSVGAKNGGKLLIDGQGENNKLIEILADYFRKYDFNVSTAKSLTIGSSDHRQFINNGINGAGLSQEGCEDIIHTLEDNFDKVDIKYIAKLSETIVDFIIDNSRKTFEPLQINVYRDGLDERSKIRDELNLNEYKYTEIDGNIELIGKNSELYYGPFFEESDYNKGIRVQDFYNAYPQFQFPENLGGYQLNYIKIVDDSEVYIDNSELDKVYTVENKIENIELLFIAYKIKGKELCKDNVLNDNIRIIIFREDKKKDIKVNYQEFYENEVDDNGIIIDKATYYPVYRKSDNKLNGLYRKVEEKDNTFHVMITVLYHEEDDWQYETIGETVDAVKELNIYTLIQDILDVFLNSK